MTKSRVRLEPGWKAQLQGQFSEPYMLELRQWLLQRAEAGAVIYPPPSQWFNAFAMTPFDNVRIVILGQDPYHGPGQAHGLCFSVLPGVRVPPSLGNIYKELRSDLGILPAAHGYLASWASQGVFLLNSVLTVEQGQAAAHQNKGWEIFTDVVIDKLANNTENTVFLLWGGYARKKGQMIDTKRHLVLQCAHPSPLSVRGFTGCRHFSQANDYLLQHGKAPIDWQLPETAVV